MKKFISAFLSLLLLAPGFGFAEEADPFDDYSDIYSNGNCDTNQNKIIYLENGEKVIYISHDNIAPLVDLLQSSYKEGKLYSTTLADKIGLLGGAIGLGATTSVLTALGTKKLMDKKSSYSNKRKIGSAIAAGISALPVGFFGGGCLGFILCDRIVDALNGNPKLSSIPFSNIKCVARQETKEKMGHNFCLSISDLSARQQQEDSFKEYPQGLKGFTGNGGRPLSGYGFHGNAKKDLIHILESVSPEERHRSKHGDMITDSRGNSVYDPLFSDAGEGIIIAVGRNFGYEDPSSHPGREILVYKQGYSRTEDTLHGRQTTTENKGSLILECLNASEDGGYLKFNLKYDEILRYSGNPNSANTQTQEIYKKINRTESFNIINSGLIAKMFD